MSEETRVDEPYERALDFLYGLINFDQKRRDRYAANKQDASRPARLMSYLGSPHETFPSIHIAGTKGKGSVAAMCAAALSASGLRVGLYTSPHVRDFRERIRILTPADRDGRIPKRTFTTLMERLKQAVEAVPGVTWFEVVTGIAFLHFAQQEVDVAVVEVGLGGRLDATNVLTPLVSVITSLSKDHTEFLGSSLPEIAREKGGIIKQGVPLVAASQETEAMDVLVEIARQREAPLFIVGRDWEYQNGARDVSGGKQQLVVGRSADTAFIPHGSSFRLALAGVHQLENGTVALATLSHVRSHFPTLTTDTAAAGLSRVYWPGRLELVHDGIDTPSVLVDCAHNVDSSSKLREALERDYHYDHLWLVLGISSGKDSQGMMRQLLPLASGTVFTVSSHPRSTPAPLLVEVATSLGHESVPSENVREALLAAWKLAGAGDLICVTGSIFVVGDLLNEWESLQSQLLEAGHPS
jgi:dihydrofolate synthase/folylpolyglutamate synthase